MKLMSVRRSFRGHRSGYCERGRPCVGVLCLRGNVLIGADCTIRPHAKVGLM